MSSTSLRPTPVSLPTLTSPSATVTKLSKNEVKLEFKKTLFSKEAIERKEFLYSLEYSGMKQGTFLYRAIAFVSQDIDLDKSKKD